MEKLKQGLSHEACMSLIGFLGGTERNDASDRCLYHAMRRQEKDEVVMEFEQDGCETFENVLTKRTCESLGKHCDEVLSNILRKEGDEEKRGYCMRKRLLLDDIKSPNKRYSLRLSLKIPIVRKALHMIAKNMYPFLSKILGSKALLYELSVIISDSGSRAQQFHSDTKILGRSSEKDALLVTIFLALQDVKKDMGPTLLYPKTHTREFHELYFGNKSTATSQLTALESRKQTSMTLKQGAGFAMNSRLLHCGGANTSTSSRRRLLCISFLGSKGNVPHGSTASLIEEYKGRIRLCDILSKDFLLSFGDDNNMTSTTPSSTDDND
jgi:hypothetical protein